MRQGRRQVGHMTLGLVSICIIKAKRLNEIIYIMSVGREGEVQD